MVVEALEKEDPGIFGPNGGYSRLYSIQGVSYTIGMLVGPELAGLLTNTAGYRTMTMVLGMLATVGHRCACSSQEVPFCLK